MRRLTEARMASICQIVPAGAWENSEGLSVLVHVTRFFASPTGLETFESNRAVRPKHTSERFD